eukprot:EG_transcript_15845
MIDLDRPRYDLTTYWGRLQHFWAVCDPRTAFATTRQLRAAEELLKQHRAGGPTGVEDEDLWHAKRLYDSAFHPDTGELIFAPARMSFQVPGNMLILGAALTLHHSALGLTLTQVANQMFNATVNYHNRNATSPVTTPQLLASFCAATTAGVAAAVGCRRFIDRRPFLRQGIVGRFIPMLAGSIANCFNIPLMRQAELTNGIVVFDEEGRPLGTSRRAARSAILQVLLSRIVMAAPAACLTPILMHRLEGSWALLRQRPGFIFPVQVMLVGLNLTLCTPMACALFSQRQSVPLSALEPHFQQLQNGNGQAITHGWFNKGL